MKFFCSAIFILLQCASCYSSKITPASISNDPSVKTILDFGAIPNDGKDDSWAFIKAGKYFSNLWDINGVPLKNGTLNFKYGAANATLEIPSGLYHVGKQINVPVGGLNTTYGELFGYRAATAVISRPANSAFKFGLDLIEISSARHPVDGISIIGTGKSRPVIKYNDGLFLGFFDSKGKELFLTDATYNFGKWGVSIGNFIKTENVKNIRIENIEVDGNNRSKKLGGKTVYGGGYGSHMIQMGGSGAYLLNTKNVLAKNLDFHHMTIDGLILQDYYRDPAKFKNQALTNFEMDSCKFNYNRRQGFSWVGGRSVKVSNSSFSFTGTTVDGNAIGNPGAGIDIEPEQDLAGEMLWCIDGIFENCQLVGNYGCALVNDATASRTKKIDFNNCTFHDVTGYSVWVKGAGITFRDCKIWGGFVYGNEGKTGEDATKFFNCDFADEEISGQRGKYNETYALIESWNSSQKMYFNNCRFRVLHPKQRLFALYNSGTREKDFYHFENCSFAFAKGADGESSLFGAVFSGNTLFENYHGNEIIKIHLNGVIVTGSRNASVPSRFISSGPLLLFPANSNGKQLTQFVLGRTMVGGTDNSGYLRFEIGKASALFGYFDQTFEVGSNTTLVNRKDGQLAILTGNINNSGKIILEDGSFTAFFQPIAINSTNKASFYLYPEAKMGVHPSWKKTLDGLGSGLGLHHMKLNTHTRFGGINREIPPGRRAQ